MGNDPRQSTRRHLVPKTVEQLEQLGDVRGAARKRLPGRFRERPADPRVVDLPERGFENAPTW